MAEKNWSLSAEQKKKIIDWLNDRLKEPACPACGNGKLRLGDGLLEGRIFQGGGLVAGGPSYPQFVLFCENCFHVRHFMATPVLGENLGFEALRTKASEDESDGRFSEVVDFAT